MSDTQANTIRDLLLAALASYDPTIPLDVGSRAYTEIISPIYDALSPDMFDADLEEYLLKTLKEEYPTLELQQGDAIVDLLVRPLQLLLEPLKREISLLKKRQSARYLEQLTVSDAEDLAANFFITRKNGSSARGVARVLLQAPTFLTITDQVRFSTNSGLVFYPLRQEVISAETVSLQQVGTLYYVDITVVAQQEGEEYNISPGELSIAEGIPRYVSVSNPFAFEQGSISESKQELLARAEQSLTERSLTSKRGITARILEDFDDIKQVNVIGYGDPEMDRDVLVGSGEGDLLASGISFVVGRYVFMITGYEDSQNGHRLPSEGNKVKFNFWKFMYTTESIENNEIQKTIYCSYGDAVDMPTVHIFLLKSDIGRPPITGGVLPGVYMGLFTSIFTDASLTISGLPLGKEVEDAVLPLEIMSNEVHIGGRYDVWARPTETSLSTSSINIQKSQYIDEDIIVYTDGETQSPSLLGRYPLNRVGLGYNLELTSHQLVPREAVLGSLSGALGYIHTINGAIATITRRSGSFLVNENVIGMESGNTASILAIQSTEANKDNVGSVVTITGGVARSVFILDVFEDYYIVSEDIAGESYGVSGYIHSQTGVKNIFDPIFKVFPEAADFSNVLQTSIGSSVVHFTANLVNEGVTGGDTIEILEGADAGRHTITSIDSLGAVSKATISEPLSRSNSNVKFRIIREESPISAPLIRIQPSGMIMSSAGGGFEIPYKKPVGAYALGAFSGSIGKYEGVNGFVLPNMGTEFAFDIGAFSSDQVGALIPNLTKQADLAWMQSNFSNAGVDDCISEGCSECAGINVTCTVTIDGTPSSYSNIKFYMTGLIGPQGKAFLQDLNTWIKSVIDSYFRGTNSQNQSVADDLQAFIDAFAPITFGEPDITNTSENIIKQFELCIPSELFDGCNNTYLAIPEFDWPSEFESVSTFYAAISAFLSGRMKAKPTALKFAKPGDSLKIHDGANKGEYVVDKVVNIPWYNGDTVATETSVDNTGTQIVTASIVESKVYDLTLVVIRGEFPNEVLKGSAEYFKYSALPTVTQLLPTVPAQQFQTVESKFVSGPQAGTFINPFSIIEEAFHTVFYTMHLQGFDLPEEFNIQPGPVLTKIIQSFFSKYTTGNRSPQQTTRMLFQDAIDTTVYAPRVCEGISWQPEEKTSPTITGSPFSLPQLALANKTVTVKFTKNFQQTTSVFTGTLPSSAGTTTDVEELVGYIQTAVDPGSTNISITYSSSSIAPFYTITITALQGGEGSYMEPEAYSFADGFGLLGFTSKSWGPLSTPASLGTMSNAFSAISKTPFSKLFFHNVPNINTLLRLRYGHLGVSNSLFCYVRVDATTHTFTAGSMYDASFEVSPPLSAPNVTITKTVQVICELESSVATFSVIIVAVGNSNDITDIENHLALGTIASTSLGSMSAPVGNATNTFFTTLAGNSDSFVNSGNPILLTTRYLDPLFFGVDLTLRNNVAFSDLGTNSVVGLQLAGNASNQQYDQIVINSRGFTVKQSSCLPLVLSLSHTGAGSAPTLTATFPSPFPPVSITTSTSPFNMAPDYLLDTLPLTINPDVTTTLNPRGETVTGGFSITIDGVVRELFEDLTVAEVVSLSEDLALLGTKELKSVAIAEFINNKYLSDGFARFMSSPQGGGEILLVSGSSNALGLSRTNNGMSPSLYTSFTIFDHVDESHYPANSIHSSQTYPISTNPVNTVVTGSSTVSSTPVDGKINAHNGTRFSITQGADERQLVVDIQNNEEYFGAIMPRRLANMQLPQSELSRDCIFSAHYTLAQSCTMFFTGLSGESAMEAGVLPGDLLYVNEQVCILDNASVFATTPFSTKKDRILHARYNPTKKSVTLLSTAGTFLTPESTPLLTGESPPEDVVQVGDYVYFEDINEVASVVRVSDSEIILDAAVGIVDQPLAMSHGFDGVVTVDQFSSNSVSFLSSDVGMYLVIYGSANPGVDGTYDILSVSAGVATISETIPNAEANLHFLVVKPDFTELGGSSINGFSETRGVTPIRIYRGTPSVFTVGKVNEYLARVSSQVEVLYGTKDGGPRRGVNQPFKVLRPYEYRISAVQMEKQGKEAKFYYFDVPTTTITPTFDLNIPENTQYTPIVSTMKTSGYDLKPLHKSHVFSTRERCELVMDSSFIPKTLNGSLKNTQSPEKETITISYESSDTLATLQSFLTREENKNLCSDPLARHFLPGYMSVSVTGSRSNDVAKNAIVGYIEGLSPTDSIRLSEIEKQLHYNSIHTYDHPIFMYCLTHDLNRNVVLTRTDNYIDDDTILHDGTNRITYFIANPDDILIGGS